MSSMTQTLTNVITKENHKKLQMSYRLFSTQATSKVSR